MIKRRSRTSTESSKDDGIDEVELTESDISSTQEPLETSHDDEETMQIAEDGASENVAAFEEPEIKVANTEDDKIEENGGITNEASDVVEEEASALEFYTKILEKAQLLITQKDWALISNELQI